MQKLNRRSLLLVVALAGGMTGALIVGAPGTPARTSAEPIAAYVQEQPYPPGFEQPHHRMLPWSLQEYPQEEGYAPGFEQPHH